jgi:hypothetical protein
MPPPKIMIRLFKQMITLVSLETVECLMPRGWLLSVIPRLSIHSIGTGVVRQCIKAEREHKGAINGPAG